MIDRCTCDGAAYETSRHPFLTHPACPVHGDVNTILASGRYVDSKGRRWGIVTSTFGWGRKNKRGFAIGGWTYTHTQMQRFIRTDQHRAGCPGLYSCHDHPAPIVWKMRLSGHWSVDYGARSYDTLPEAMDAAIDMTKTFTRPGDV